MLYAGRLERTDRRGCRKLTRLATRYRHYMTGVVYIVMLFCRDRDGDAGPIGLAEGKVRRAQSWLSTTNWLHRSALSTLFTPSTALKDAPGQRSFRRSLRDHLRKKSEHLSRSSSLKPKSLGALQKC